MLKMAGFLQKVAHQLFIIQRSSVQQSLKCHLRTPTVLQSRTISYSNHMYGDDKIDDTKEKDSLLDDKYIGKIGDMFVDGEKLPRRKRKETRQRKQRSYDDDSIEIYDDYTSMKNDNVEKPNRHKVKSMYLGEDLERYENSQAKQKKTSKFAKTPTKGKRLPDHFVHHNNDEFYNMKADSDFLDAEHNEIEGNKVDCNGVGHSVIENLTVEKEKYRSRSSVKVNNIHENQWKRFQMSGPVSVQPVTSKTRNQKMQEEADFVYDIDDCGRIQKKKPNHLKLDIRMETNRKPRARNLRIEPDDPDSFGTLSRSTDIQPDIDDEKEFDDDAEEDGTMHLRLSRKNRKHNPSWYENKIKALGKEGKVRECIEVFEVWMLKNDRVLPTCSVVSTYLGVLGRAGYTKKAFKVYNQMKKMKGVTLHEPTYTALFNACANSPWKEDGLQRAVDLRNLMLRKDIQPDSITYKAMIKAFGCLGDFPTAFLLADEAASNKINIDIEYFSFLVMAAISDKNAGFRYGIEIWRKMLQWHIKPDIYLYNLLLKLTHECSIGNKEDFHLMFAPAANQSKTLSLPAEREKLSLGAGSTNSQEIQTVDTLPNSVVVTQDSNIKIEQLPDILNPKETYSDVVAIAEVETAQDRLALIGGLDGFLKRMRADNVVPNILTFTQLLNVVDTEVQKDLLTLMDTYKVEPDAVFFNAMIHQCCMRREMEAAKAVVPLMTKYGVTPDMRTYSGLALTCKDREDGLRLIDEIQEVGIMPNSVVFGSLIYASSLDMVYKMEILMKMESLGVSPSERTLQRIESQMAAARRKIPYKNKWFEDAFESFRKFYEEWLHRVNVEEIDHPWKSFSIRPGNRKLDPDRFKTKLEEEQRASRRVPITHKRKRKDKTVRMDN